VLDFIEQNKGLWPKLGYWLDVQYSKNQKILYKEAKMTGRQMLFRDLVADGFFADELRESREEGWQKGRQDGVQEGWQKGRQEERQEIFALLDKGYSVEEIKKRLQPA
jgi:predicted transposase YdaD